MQVLNKHADCETHHTQSPFDQATLVPAGTKKTITDAWNGYHSVPIREEDRHLTTFITPWGRYRYKTCPQGYDASQDGYPRRFDEIVNDFPNKTKCIDETCLWADTLEESFFQTCRWLDICGRHGIVQNPEMFVFGSDTVEFAGFVITPIDIQPSDKHICAICDFPTPQNITDIRFWFGLINQVSYCDSIRNDMGLSASISSRRQRSIGMISCNKFLSNQNLLYWTKSPRVSGYSTPNVSHVSPQIGPRKASVFGSCRSTARVRSSLLSVAQRDGK